MKRNPRPILLDDRRGRNRIFHQRDETEMAQLMRLAPFQEALLPSLEATAALKEAIGEAVDALGDEEQLIFNLLFVERLSLRRAAEIILIPKTTLARRRDKIRRRLMLDLVNEPAIQDWMYRDFRIPASFENNEKSYPSTTPPTWRT